MEREEEIKKLVVSGIEDGSGLRVEEGYSDLLTEGTIIRITNDDLPSREKGWIKFEVVSLPDRTDEDVPIGGMIPEREVVFQ